MSEHPSTFKIKCAVCDVPRFAVTSLLVCLICDRAVKEGLIVGPDVGRMTEIPQGWPPKSWDVRVDKL